MKKGIAILLLAALVLGMFACGKERPVSPALEFQDIPWNSSPEEVFEKLGVDQETLTWGEKQKNGLSESFVVTAGDWNLFGETAFWVGFIFENYTPEENDAFGLSQVQVFYPEDCNKNTVLKNLRAQYGMEPEAYTEYRLTSEKPEVYTYTKEPGRYVWVSQRVLDDLLSDQGKAEYREVLGKISDEDFQMVLQNPVGRIVWVEDYYGQFETDMEEAIQQNGRVALLNFSGSTAIMRQEFDTVE